MSSSDELDYGLETHLDSYYAARQVQRAFESDPFNGTYVLCWRHFPKALPGKEWEANFRVGNDRFAAVLQKDSPVPQESDSFVVMYGIDKADLASQARKSGIKEVSVYLCETMPIQKQFPSLHFEQGINPRTKEHQWEATIHLSSATIKIILDREAEVEPVEGGNPHEWIPTAVLHRNRNRQGREFILMSAVLKMTPAEREAEVIRVAEKKANEALLEAARKAEADRAYTEWQERMNRMQEERAQQARNARYTKGSTPGSGCGSGTPWTAPWRPRPKGKGRW